MSMPVGVYRAYKKDSTEYYRVSITFNSKHISLGSYDSIKLASKAYRDADKLLHNSNHNTINTSTFSTNYKSSRSVLSFEKWIILTNFRDNGIYFKTPIYLCRKYFLYFLEPHTVLKFDVDDLFYYSNHKIMARNGYLFVNDYGMQTSILSRYGLKHHAVCNRDYKFANADNTDYRYGNIIIINQYFGVQQIKKNGRQLYKVKIHIIGDYVIGTYSTEKEAAIAYNKTIDILKSKNVTIQYTQNYLEDTTDIEYAKIYNSTKISKKIRELSFE